MARFTKITSPSEFGGSIGGQDFVLHQWLPQTPEAEPEIRHAIDEIFNDLAYIDSGDRAFVAAFLDGIAEPLGRLQSAFGLQLVCGTTRGKLKLPPTQWEPNPKEIKWERSYYIVAPDPAYFRSEDGRVHKLGTSCREAFMLATDPPDHLSRTVWGSLDSVHQAFEGAPPWCPTCRTEAPETL